LGLYLASLPKHVIEVETVNTFNKKAELLKIRKKAVCNRCKVNNY